MRQHSRRQNRPQNPELSGLLTLDSYFAGIRSSVVGIAERDHWDYDSRKLKWAAGSVLLKEYVNGFESIKHGGAPFAGPARGVRAGHDSRVGGTGGRSAWVAAVEG